MKLLLLNPFFTTEKGKQAAMNPMLGLAYLAAYIASKGYEVSVLDVLAAGIDTVTELDDSRQRHGLTAAQIQAYLAREKPAVVGIACIYTAYARDALDLAGIVKQADPSLYVIFGGAHASAYADQVIQDPHVDLVVRGEGEETLLEVLRRLQAGARPTDVLGTTVRPDGVVRANPPRPQIENLDVLPFPDRTRLPLETYLAAYSAQTNYLMRDRAATMVTSRGCPMDCVYCAVKTVWGKTWRARSAKNVVDEIEYLVKEFRIGEIHFMDDCLAVDRRRLNDICDEIIARRLDVKWTTPNGIAVWQLTPELVTKMKAAGCYRLTFGLESGNKETLAFIGKGYNLDKARELIAHCHRIGLWTLGTFIIGFPDEPESSLRDTIAYALSTRLDFAVFYTATPFPGTRLFEIFAEEGLLINPQASIFTGGCNTRYFTQAELSAWQDRAFREFMRDRLRRPWRFLTHLRRWEDVRYLFKLIRNLGLRLVLFPGRINPSLFWRKKTAPRRPR
jgi:anaerobic magnesium-protoporphyrin IX monomethyl ester cyclase